MIPDRLTSICQSLDIAINKLFKDYLHKEWHLWMANSDAEETKNGNLWCVKLSEVCGWVKYMWDNFWKKQLSNLLKNAKYQIS